MDNRGQGDASGEKRHATLRCRTASLTAAVSRVSYDRRSAVPGEGAR
ncbi:DUF6380 family protein [Streptomyces sp. NPDC048566]